MLILKYTLESELYIENTLPIYDKHNIQTTQHIQAIRTMHISTCYNTTILITVSWELEVIAHAPLWVRTEAIFLLSRWSLLFFFAIKRSIWCVVLHFDINRAIVGKVLLNFKRKIRYLLSSIM